MSGDPYQQLDVDAEDSDLINPPGTWIDTLKTFFLFRYS